MSFIVSPCIGISPKLKKLKKCTKTAKNNLFFKVYWLLFHSCQIVSTNSTFFSFAAAWNWICWFGALKFNHNWIKHKNRRKNTPVFAVFEHFWRFSKFDWILAHQTTKFTFLDVYCFFWHPTHLWMCLSSAWKKIWPYLAECDRRPCQNSDVD